LSFQRPVLIILDRNFDLATPLHHTWTYQALMHDVFDISLNKVEIDKDKEATVVSKDSKKYDLSSKDNLWKQQKGNPFPVVAESIQEELEKYKQYDGEIKNLKDTYVKFILFISIFEILKIKKPILQDSESHNEESMSLLFNNTSKLTKAISSLPELTEMKRMLDMHTNIATSLLDHIKVKLF
jgi:hypothetical protein